MTEKNKLKLILKKILSNSPFLYKFFQKFYRNYKYGTYFTPINLDENTQFIVNAKAFKLDLKNFNKFKNKNDYFLISKNKQIKNYSTKKLEKLLHMIKVDKKDVAYDGDSFAQVEITSKGFLENYLNKKPIKNYPRGFFYFKDGFKIGNIGCNHRSYNFNGSFILPSGGETIGDQGNVTNRLKYIPNLQNKTFLDIGSEEGYAVFDAIKKGAKFAKGLNIKELKEYDFFPEYSRPSKITARERNEIDKTQKFLIKEYGLQNESNLKFEYRNIYDLSDERFDFVFCFGVLYHLKNPYLALENLYKVTNETLIIETQGIKNDKYLNARVYEGDGFIRHSSNSLAYLLKMAGFEKVDILLDAYDPSMKIMNIILKAQK